MPNVLGEHGLVQMWYLEQHYNCNYYRIKSVLTRTYLVRSYKHDSERNPEGISIHADDAAVCPVLGACPEKH